MLVLRIFYIATVHKEMNDFLILYCIIYHKLVLTPIVEWSKILLIVTTFIEEHIICIFYLRLLNHEINQLTLKSFCGYLLLALEL